MSYPISYPDKRPNAAKIEQYIHTAIYERLNELVEKRFYSYYEYRSSEAVTSLGIATALKVSSLQQVFEKFKIPLQSKDDLKYAVSICLFAALLNGETLQQRKDGTYEQVLKLYQTFINESPFGHCIHPKVMSDLIEEGVLVDSKSFR